MTQSPHALFDFREDEVIGEILNRQARRVLLQFPEGLKRFASLIAASVEAKTGATVYVSGDPCYGACDLPVDEAARLSADLIVHYGHTKFELGETPNVFYVPVEAKALAVRGVVEKALELLKPYRRVGLLTTAQHLHAVKDTAEVLAARGKTVILARAGGRFEQEGQILGCDYTPAKKIQDEVEAFLYVGGGDFHPLGAALATSKPVIVADPFSGTVKDVTFQAEALLRRRKGVLARFLEAKSVGVIVSPKSGQFSPQAAEKIKQALERVGKKPMLLCMREVVPESLDNFPDLEAFVNTACPRIGLDDADRYRKPVVNAQEVMVLLFPGPKARAKPL